MTEQFSMDDREVRVLLDLLEAERMNLPPEIRRTDTISVHDNLQERLKIVDDLINRLRSVGTHA